MYEYTATILDWLDGDTAKVNLDLGFQISLNRPLRVYGINCPEVHTADVAEKVRGIAARAYAATLCPVGSKVVVSTIKVKDESDKYGRILGKVTLSDGHDYATAMIEAGHALAYFGVGPKPI